MELLKALNKTDDWFSKYIDVSTFGMIFTNFETKKLKYANASFFSTSGYTNEDVFNKTSVDLGLFEQGIPESLYPISSNPDATIVSELLIKKKNGTFFWAQTLFQKIIINQIKYTFITFIDISARKNTDKEFVLIVKELNNAGTQLIKNNYSI